MKKLYYRLIGKNPANMPMVSWWRRTTEMDAKLTTDKDGSAIMIVEGEKYPLKGFPRGHILFGTMSKLKHEIKNQIFNDSWEKLENGWGKEDIIRDIKKTLSCLIVRDDSPLNGREYKKGESLSEIIKYDLVPPEKMCTAVREIYRAWTKVSPESSQIRDYICHILQDDDSYLNRVQWLVMWFGFRSPLKAFERALTMLEHGEVISDMKERQRLLKRILMLVLEDDSIRRKFIALFKEIDWKKVRLTEADKYNFRAKYFKVDLDKFDY